MADEKVQSNGNITVTWVPAAGIADYRSPTPTELNAGIDLTDAIAWDGFELGASDSNDVDDRSLRDLGNAVTRGFQQFAATIPFFRDSNPLDTTSDYTKAFQLFREPRVYGYLVTRVLQVPASTATPYAAGQWISVFKFVGDYVADDTEGEDSYKFTVGFLPQGEVSVYTLVKTATPVVIAPTTLTLASAGAKGLLTATLSGKSITQGATWTSSAPNIAKVTPNGVVIRVSAGTATISASHPAASAAGTATITLT